MSMRPMLVQAAVEAAQAAGADASDPSVVETFPPICDLPDFNLGTDDLAAGIETPSRVNGHAPEPEPMPEPAPIPVDPQAALMAAETELGAAREALREAGQTVKAARAGFATALQAWQAGFPRVTPEANARAYIASEQAKRQAVAEGRPMPSGRAPDAAPRSVVDAVGRGSRAGSADVSYGRGYARRVAFVNGEARPILSAANYGRRLKPAQP